MTTILNTLTTGTATMETPGEVRGCCFVDVSNYLECNVNLDPATDPLEMKEVPALSTTHQAAAPVDDSVANLTSVPLQDLIKQEVQVGMDKDGKIEMEEHEIMSPPTLNPLADVQSIPVPFEFINCVVKQELDTATGTSYEHPAERQGGPSTLRYYQCHTCLKKFASRVRITKHFQTDFPEQPCKLSCRFCIKTFPDTSRLICHLRSHNNDALLSNNYNNTGYLKNCVASYVKRFDCSQCDETFAWKGHFQDHVLSHSGDKPFPCSICGRSFPRKKSLEVHFAAHTSGARFHCAICDANLNSDTRFQDHMRAHTGERPFECQTCGQRFSAELYLRSHLLSHENARSYKCTKCDKGFNRKDNLNAHMKTHSDEKPFTCVVCSKSFSQVPHLRQHLQSHSDRRDHECTLCDWSFTLKRSLLRHMKTHTGEKTHACSLCGMCFGRKDVLSAHLRNHKNAKFKCTRCDWSCNRRKSWLIHLVMHEEEEIIK